MDEKCHDRILRLMEAWTIVLFPWVLLLEQPAKTDHTFDIEYRIFPEELMREG